MIEIFIKRKLKEAHVIYFNIKNKFNIIIKSSHKKST